MQSFGHASVAEDGTLTIKLIGIDGEVKLEKTLSPEGNTGGEGGSSSEGSSAAQSPEGSNEGEGGSGSEGSSGSAAFATHSIVKLLMTVAAFLF